MKKIFVILLIVFLCSCDSTDRIEDLERTIRKLENRIEELESRIEELENYDFEDMKDRIEELEEHSHYHY
jgi:predicted RNase H-like nuclease (RuvC/YqgF family)